MTTFESQIVNSLMVGAQNNISQCIDTEEKITKLIDKLYQQCVVLEESKTKVIKQRESLLGLYNGLHTLQHITENPLNIAGLISETTEIMSKAELVSKSTIPVEEKKLTIVTATSHKVKLKSGELLDRVDLILYSLKGEQKGVSVKQILCEIQERANVLSSIQAVTYALRSLKKKDRAEQTHGGVDDYKSSNRWRTTI